MPDPEAEVDPTTLRDGTLTVEPHPMLALGLLEIHYPSAIGALASTAWLAALLAIGAPQAPFSPDDALSWDLHLGPPLRAERTARPLSSDAPQRDERVQVTAAIGWAIFVLNLVGWLAYLARRKA